MAFKFNVRAISFNFTARFNDSQFSDFTVKSIDGHEFKLHRVILSQRSNFFEAMFLTDMKEGNSNEVTLCETAKILVILFRIIYGIECEIDQKECIELCRVSKKYLINDVFELCAKKLEANLAPSAAADILIFAHENDMEQLKQKALACIKGDLKKVRDSSGWETLTQNIDLLNLVVDALIEDVENYKTKLMSVCAHNEVLDSRRLQCNDVDQNYSDGSFISDM